MVKKNPTTNIESDYIDMRKKRMHQFCDLHLLIRFTDLSKLWIAIIFIG